MSGPTSPVRPGSAVPGQGRPVPGPPPSRESPAAAPAVEPAGDGLPELVLTRPLPGFPQLDRFVLVRMDDEEAGSSPAPAVLFELRSVQDAQVSFMVAVPEAFFPEYTVELDRQTCTELGIEEEADTLLLVVLTVGPDAASTTANLLAPVVINARTRSAAQVILSGTDWPVRAALVA